jgi:hypothetical protein
MSANRPELTPDVLRRILPALRLMVRFPTRPAKVVSFETGIELSDIYAYTETRGRPKPKDIETIEHELEDGPAPKFTNIETPAVSAKLAAVEPPAPAPQPASPAAPRVFVAAPNDQPWLHRRLQGKAMRLYAPVVAWLIENPRESNAAACRQFKCDEGAFSAWRIGVFGRQLPGPEMFSRFVEWANEQLKRRGEDTLGLSLKLPGEGSTAIAPSCVALAPTPTEVPRHHPPQTPRHTADDSARNGAREIEPQSDCPAAASRHVVAALTALRDKYVAELERLQKTLAGIERAIDCTKAKIEAAEECVEIVKGGAS